MPTRPRLARVCIEIVFSLISDWTIGNIGNYAEYLTPHIETHETTEIEAIAFVPTEYSNEFLLFDSGDNTDLFFDTQNCAASLLCYSPCLLDWRLETRSQDSVIQIKGGKLSNN